VRALKVTAHPKFRPYLVERRLVDLPQLNHLFQRLNALLNIRATFIFYLAQQRSSILVPRGQFRALGGGGRLEPFRGWLLGLAALLGQLSREIYSRDGAPGVQKTFS
jgi:hypothetical protein